MNLRDESATIVGYRLSQRRPADAWVHILTLGVLDDLDHHLDFQLHLSSPETEPEECQACTVRDLTRVAIGRRPCRHLTFEYSQQSMVFG